MARILPAGLLLVALLTALTAYLVASASNSGGAVVFVFEVLGGGSAQVVDPLGRQVPPSGIAVIAQVHAIAPPNSSSVVEEVFWGELRGPTLRLDSRGPLGDVARGWVAFEKARGSLQKESEVGLELSVWLVDESSGAVLASMSGYYTYSPKGLLEGETREYRVKVRVGQGQANAGVRDIGVYQPGCFSAYVWRLKYEVTPEDALGAYGGDYRYHNGAYYIKLPILALYNKYLYSGLVDSAIGLDTEYKTWFYVSLGISTGVEAKLKSGDVTGGLDSKVKLAGRSREIRATGFWDPNELNPNEKVYVWIWARPVMLFYNEYYIVNCPGYYKEEYTGRDKVEFLVQDVITSYLGSIDGRDIYLIEGGESASIPQYIEEWVFNNTLSDYKPLLTLDPNVGVTFKALIETSIDVCRADFEISLGAALAPAVASINALRHFTPLSVMMGPSLSWGESEERFVSGGIRNEGPQFSESLYVRVSKLRYVKEPFWPWQDPCYYRIPVSMYIESR